MSVKLRETPLLDELDKGPWPSFVREIKKSAEDGKEAANDLLGVLELSYKEKISHWKHGGIVGVFGYGGGVIGRYSDLGHEYPHVAHFHTIRVNQPAGWFYTTEALREICDIWEAHGSGLTNMHGSTGDMVFLGTTTDELEPVFEDLTKKGWDLGGSGSDVRTPSACCGPARCEFACYDTLAMVHDITNTYQDELHRPQFPYKYKFKFSGCANDCVASIARSDMSFIGTWADDIRINQDAVAEYADKGVNILRDVVMNCPTKCMEYDGKTIEIDNENCVRCMHCINVLPKALRHGENTGATILLGAKAPIVQGAQLASVFIPFWKPVAPYSDLKELVDAIWEVWCEEGKNRERIGEFIQRVGMSNFLDAVGLDPNVAMISHPRDNPYIFFQDEDEDEE